MAAGVVLGYAGLVDGLVGRLKGEIDFADQVQVVATGGLAQVVQPYTETLGLVMPGLTLEGLALIHDRRS